MERRTWSYLLIVALVFVLAPRSAGKESVAQTLKAQERYTLSLELEFTRRSRRPLQKAVEFLLDAGPNGYATGFLVGDGLVMTAYHVVSGELSDSKKIILGFSPNDLLDVKVFVKGRQATILKVDKDADLALLSVEGSSKPTNNEKLMLIARPNGDKIISHGILYGLYKFRGMEYWSAKIEGRDGYSGSPVYNQKAEVIGIFSGYDWSQRLALISPGERAQKLLEDYNANLSAKP